MPKILDTVPANAAYGSAAYQQREESAPTPSDAVHMPYKTHTRSSVLILATGGSTAGAAFLGGLLAGPVGAVGGALVGATVGLLLYKTKK